MKTIKYNCRYQFYFWLKCLTENRQLGIFKGKVYVSVCTTVTLTSLLIRRNRMHHVQITSSSLMLCPRALNLIFSLSSPLDKLSLPSPFCSNDSRTLSALRETFTNASQPTPNVLIRKNSDSQNTSGKGRGS